MVASGDGSCSAKVSKSHGFSSYKQHRCQLSRAVELEKHVLQEARFQSI